MTAYAVVALTVNDPELYETYVGSAVKSIEPYGVEALAMDDEPIVLEGSSEKRVIILRADSIEDLQAWYDSPAYQDVVAIRHKSTTTASFTLVHALEA